MISICIASYNAVNALKLTHKSFDRHHPDIEVQWLVGDNQSDDGAREYAATFADVFDFDHSHEHGRILDELSFAAKGEYILFLDNDVEFLRPCVEAPVKTGRNFGVCLRKGGTNRGRQFVQHGFTLTSMPRIDPCLALFERPLMEDLLWPSWSTYVSYGAGEFFDTGSMKFMAHFPGRKLPIMSWEQLGLGDAFVHYGSISSGFRTTKYGGSVPDNYEARYQQITERLKLYS